MKVEAEVAVEDRDAVCSFIITEAFRQTLSGKEWRAIVREALHRSMAKVGVNGPFIYRVSPAWDNQSMQVMALAGPKRVRHGLSVRQARKRGAYV